ncbi:MAG: ATP-binding protein [Myxococcaceae bacterium]|nr:ATP-binding protein [Myxococcaceae bacterium]
MPLAQMELRIPSLWDLLPKVREEVSRHLSGLPDDVRDDAVMAVSELVENAIKYARPGPSGDAAALSIECSPKALRLTVSSMVRSPEAARSTVERVRVIQQAPSRFALYLNRLHQLAEAPTASAQLGLFRIASEGEFELDCLLQDDTLHITATRELS